MLDDLDRALIHALHIDGRAPFHRMAAALGVSPQTVARRYRRLRIEAPVVSPGEGEGDGAQPASVARTTGLETASVPRTLKAVGPVPSPGPPSRRG
jgi:DNA-binding transcriptional regulator YhcF (GntR family)